MAFSRKDLEDAAKGNPSARRFYDRMVDWINAAENQLGIDPLHTTQLTPDRFAPPPLASFEVVGANGLFTVTIINPSGVDIPLLHNLQSSETVPFETSQTVVDYGISTQLSLIVTDPGKTYYWRLRSRYPSGQFNRWQIFSNTAISSGTATSGALPNIALPQVPDEGVSPLVQLDMTLNIIINPSSVQIGSNLIEYGGDVIEVPAYDVWYIYALDPDRLGGSVQYLYTTNPADVSSSDGAVFFGRIVMYADGGGQGSNAFSSNLCVVAGTQVRMSDGATKLIENIIPGDKVKSIDGGLDNVVRINTLSGRPCFALGFSNGVTVHGMASSHVVIKASGGFAQVIDLYVGDQLLALDAVYGNTALVLSSKTLLAGGRQVYQLFLDRTHSYNTDSIWSRDL